MSDHMPDILLALGKVQGTLESLVSAVGRGHSRIDACETRLNALEVEGGKVGLKVYILCAGVAAVLTAALHFGFDAVKDKLPTTKASMYVEGNM